MGDHHLPTDDELATQHAQQLRLVRQLQNEMDWVLRGRPGNAESQGTKTSSDWLAPTPDHHKWFLYPLILALGGVIVAFVSIIAPSVAKECLVAALALFLGAIGVAACDRLIKRWTKVASVAVLVVVWGVASLALSGKPPFATSYSSAPEAVTLVKAEIAQPATDVAGLHPLANVYFQNGSTPGTSFHTGSMLLTPHIYSDDDAADAAAVRATADVAKVSPSSPISAHEQQWFTVVGNVVTAKELKGFVAGTRALYFAGSIIIRDSHGGESRTPYCYFAIGSQINILHVCPGTDSASK